MVLSKRRETPLTREELFGRALAIVDEHGLAALTMRRLAEDVGVEAASLYHHVPNKDALIEGVLVTMRSEVRLPDPLPEDWIDVMEAIFAEYRRVLAAHPNLTPYAGRHVESDPEEEGLVSLTHLGFSSDEAVELWQSLIAFVVGFSVFSSSYAETDTSALPEGLAGRMAQWRDETCKRTLRVILEGYDRGRTV